MKNSPATKMKWTQHGNPNPQHKVNFVKTVIKHKRRKDQAVKASPLRFNSRKLGKRHQIVITALTTVNYISLYLSLNSNTTKTRPYLGPVSFRSGSTCSMPLVEAQVFFLRNLPYSMLDSQLATHYHRWSDVTPPTLQSTSRKARMCATAHAPKAT